jgi:hypothetical protein
VSEKTAKKRRKANPEDVITKAIRGLDNYDRMLLRRPDMTGPTCVFCGKPAENNHHLIPRSRLIKAAQWLSPIISVCGLGNASGCHGDLHSGRKHVRYFDRFEVEGWEYLTSDVPISRDEAHARDGWKRLKG